MRNGRMEVEIYAVFETDVEENETFVTQPNQSLLVAIPSGKRVGL